MASFFVPGATPERQEQIYAALAEYAGRAPAAPTERIRAITYLHDGQTWTAEIGQQLTGTATRTRTRRGRRIEVIERLHDGATVRAIFAGDPYVVVTDARPIGRAPSAWNNPIYAGAPEAVSHFG